MASIVVQSVAGAVHESIDPSRFPPAAAAKVDFARDIKPTLEGTCWRCHGPERPKSHFRLDNRESALKGGDNGVDIIPGDSAKSPLIHYIARLVPDMEMPPPGKGEPLSREQVALFRAWIDQGALWGMTNPPAHFAFSAAPTLRWIGVEGDKSKFRELEGMKEGFGGGVEHFSMEERIGPDKRVTAEGHVLLPDHDFQIKLAVEKTDLGFVRGGFEQWRKYYDDTGGYYRAFAIPSFDLNRDLHLDIGRLWVDGGLTLPNWPVIILGYEYQFREGAKSMLEWGQVGTVEGKNIYPAAKNIDEHVHVAKLEISHEFLGWHLQDQARVELYTLRTSENNDASFSLGPGPDTVVQTREGGTHVQGMNTVHLERQVTDWWLLSGGYLYSRFDGDASFSQATVDAAGVPVSGQFWSSDIILLKREAHVFSVTSLLLPVNGLSLSLGVQSEWDSQEGAGKIRLDSGDPFMPESFTLLPASLQADLDRTKLMEDAGLRFTKIPFTVLFAEGRFEQESIGQFEQEDTSSVPPNIGARDAFLRDTDADNDLRDSRVGFNTSPWPWVTLSGHVRNRLSETDYNHRLDLTVDPVTGALIANPGYSAFIRHRKIDTDEAQAKLVLRPVHWLRTTFTYQRVATDFSTETDPVPGGAMPEGLLAGTYDAYIYGAGVTLTPFQRFYFSGTFTYSDSRTATAQHGNPSVVPYRGDIYSVIATANFTLNPATELHAAYSFSRADYSQNNFADGLPLGVAYTRHGLMAGVSRRFTANLSCGLRYGFYQYSEPSSGGFNDYTAHGVFATMNLKWL